LKLKWRQSSPDRKIGLEPEEEAAVNKNGKSRGREQSAEKQPMLPLHGLARAALWDTVVISGLALVEEEMEAERAALCGPRYAHLAERQAQRSGGYHVRIFEKRMRDLGLECKAKTSPLGRQFTQQLSDAKASDNDKLLYATSFTPDVEAFFKPFKELAENVKDDLESKELFKLYVQDEISSAKWLMEACATLNVRLLQRRHPLRALTLSCRTRNGPMIEQAGRHVPLA
jgi:hypothetical protein